MRCDHLRITPEQHKRIREILYFQDTNKVEPFTSEPIHMLQASLIAEYIIGNIVDVWVVETFKKIGYESRPVVSLSTFINCLLNDFNI